MSKDHKELVNKALTMFLFMCNLSFNLVNNYYFKFFLKTLHSGYSAPSSWTFANPLLDQAYETCKAKVDRVIATAQYLNFFVDESTDITDCWISNINVGMLREIFHSASEHIEASSMTAEENVAWIMHHIDHVVQENWEKVNALTTNTCNTMQKIWKLLAQQNQLSHVLFILCDSHSLQLALKDLLEPKKSWSGQSTSPLTEIQQIYKIAKAIVAFFQKAPLQLTILQIKQISQYSKHKSLIAAAITQWGTSYGVVKSLQNSYTALHDWTFDARAKSKNNRQHRDIKTDIRFSSFCMRLNDLVKIIKSIHEAQKTSEASEAHLDQVVSQWSTVESALWKVHSQISSELQIELYNFLTGPWLTRKQTQLAPVHYLAYYLTPVYHDQQITREMQHLLKTELVQYLGDKKARNASRLFYEFQQQLGEFCNRRWTPLPLRQKGYAQWSAARSFASTHYIAKLVRACNNYSPLKGWLRATTRTSHATAPHCAMPALQLYSRSPQGRHLAT